MKPTVVSAILAGAATLAAPAHADLNLTAETGGPGSEPYVLMMYLAEELNKAGIANLQVLEGQTFTNSIINVAEKKSDIVPAPLVLTFYLENGVGPYASYGDEGKDLAGNLRALYPYWAGAYTLLAQESADIESYEDLRGKKVYDGPPRGAALIGARQQMMMVAGLEPNVDFTAVEVNHSQAAATLTDGSVDAYVGPLTFPSDKVTVAQSVGDVVIVSTPKEIWESEGYQKIFNAPGNIPVEIPWEQMGYEDGEGVRLISDDGVFRSFGVAFADMVHKDMDFELARSITATFIANLDNFYAKAPLTRNMNVGNLDARSTGFCGAMPVKYHPGAVAAWEEAGYTLPDCAKD